MGDGLVTGWVAIGIGLILNLVALVAFAMRLSSTVRFLNKVLETAVTQQKEIAEKQSRMDARLYVVEDRLKLRQ